MNFRSGVPWYDLLYTSTKEIPNQNIPGQEVRRLLQKSTDLYNEYVQSQQIDDELTKEIMESGTRKDKYFAIKDLIEKTPLLSIQYLHQLNEMMKSKPRIAIEAMQNTIQIYTEYLLPSRPLKKFEDQPLKTAKDTGLLLFYFEDQLKRTYSTFIKNVETMAKARQQFVRESAIKGLGELLKAAPENEQALLTVLVDKFGDPLKQVSYIAQTALLSVLKKHPQMTQSVINAIKSQQPNFTEESQNRTMKFIGQLQLNKSDTETAKDLIETVKPKLLEILKTPNDESKSKALSSLMRSAAKCAAASTDPKDMESLIQPLYDYAKSAPLNVTLPALKLLYTIHKLSGQIPIEFYNFFYSALLANDFLGSSKHSQLLNLLMEALSNEKDDNIVCNFIQRLLQVGLEMNITFATAVLVFIIKLFELKPQLTSIFQSENPEADKNYDFYSTDLKDPSAKETFPWILSLYVTHYHPAIQQLSKALISQQQGSINYEGDVYDDFTTTNQLYRIAHGSSSNSNDNELFNNCFREFDEIPDFPDEDDLEEKEKEVEKERQNQKSKQNKSQKQKQTQNKKQNQNKSFSNKQKKKGKNKK